MISKITFRWIEVTVLLLLLMSCGNPAGGNGKITTPDIQSTKRSLEPLATKPQSEVLPKPIYESPPIELNPSPTPCEIEAEFNSYILTEIGNNKDSCLPDHTNEGIGIYIYDLENNSEMVSINPDVPFQFGSTFKAPLLVYFLSSCKNYWDISSSEWQNYFLDQEAINSDQWYSSGEYEQIIKEYLSDVNNWGEINIFSAENLNRYSDRVTSPDLRYFILQQVYSMITQSNNIAAGNVLNFIYGNCQSQQVHEIEPKCGGSNAITEFNYWFNVFSNIEYKNDEPHRGLHSWDIITLVDGNGIKSETRMATYGLQDACALQGAFVGCSSTDYANNSWTAMDLFNFYRSLYYLNDLSVKETAFEILKVDQAGLSRGLMKNMARKLGAVSISKNGSSGYVLADAGILEYQNKHYVVVATSYNARISMNKLYGQYNLLGEPIGDTKGLIEQFLSTKLNNCVK